MEKPQFIKGHIYHIYNRGVEKRDVFLDKADHLRFIHDLFEFNDIESVPPSNIRFSLRYPSRLNFQCLEVQLPNIEKREGKPRKILVEILVFCLMPNHFHLLVEQKTDGGIVKFMHKLGTGYTNFFNQKYKRVGSLFQGRFKAVLVEREEHLLHLPYYIHLNPVELIEPNWKEQEIKNFKKVMKFLESYRWSSYLDYIGKKNFPSVTSREFLTELLGKPEEYKKETENWLKELDLEEIDDVLIE